MIVTAFQVIPTVHWFFIAKKRLSFNNVEVEEVFSRHFKHYTHWAQSWEKLSNLWIKLNINIIEQILRKTKKRSRRNCLLQSCYFLFLSTPSFFIICHILLPFYFYFLFSFYYRLTFFFVNSFFNWRPQSWSKFYFIRWSPVILYANKFLLTRSLTYLVDVNIPHK